MKRNNVLAIVLSVSACLAAGAQESWFGRWEGALQLAEGNLPFGLTVCESGALLDMPTQELYGYPTALARIGADTLELAWIFGGGQFLLSTTLGGASPGGAPPISGRRVDGRYGQGGANGPFFMVRSSFQPDEATSVSFAGSGGVRLPGTLLLPQGAMAKPPLIILHAGLGAADRNGNNYNLAGRNDALKQLAEALALEGVATYRYDKRGSGLSSWLVPNEESLSFEAWIDDLAACADWLGRDARYSGVYLLGLNDGALVAAAAAKRTVAEKGLIVACASADSPLDAMRAAVASAPAENRAEGEAIIAALVAGRTVTGPSAFYLQAFRPSFQPYLIEAFRNDLEPELAFYDGKLLIIQGNRDMQATIDDFGALTTAAPFAQTAVIPAMNHVLKDVPPEVDENNRAFGDPAFPVSPALIQALTDFLGSS